MPGQATITVSDRQWQVSIADTPWELAQGLGGLPELAVGTGMLFDTGWTQLIQVTTVPMLFSLDIAFFSETLVITEIYRNIEPGYVVTSTLPARYFLEVNAGELEGIEAGNTALVEFLPLEEISVAPDWMFTMMGFMGYVIVGVFMVSLVRDFVTKALEKPREKPLLYGPRGERLLPQTAIDQELPARILAGLKGKDEQYRAYVKYPPDKSAFVIIGSIIGGHYSWNPQGFSVWVSAWKERPEYRRDSILRIGELRPGRSYSATEEEVRRALDYVEREYPTFTESTWVSNSIPIYVAQELGILGLERLPQTTATHERERQGRFKIEQDRMGNIIITHTQRPEDVFLQLEADKEVVYDILKKSERQELDKGWTIEIKESEPRASILQELWEATRPESLLSVPAEKEAKTLAVFMEVAEWYVKHQKPMTVKELRPIAMKHFKTEEELTEFYEYLASPEGQKEFRRELRAAMRRHGIPIPPEEEWLPLTTEGGFKPGEIVNYKGERVRVLEHIGDRVSIFIPSRQEEVWVKPEALQRIEGKQTAQREPTGTCYENAWRFLIKEGEGELVHGTVQTIGKRINHAWVETETGYVWEPESGEFMKKAYFYERAKPRVEARYTGEEAAIMAARTKNLGPWTEQERRQYLKKKSPAVIPTQPRRPRPRKDELEFLPDSPEVLAQTIDAIGYRERIDTAFQEAIKRAKGLTQWRE